MTQARHTPEHLATWRRDGVVVIPDFFTADEVAAVTADFERVFPRTGADEAMVKRKPGEAGRFNAAQFTGVQSAPIDCSPALNLAGAHPALMAFAAEALGTDDLFLYQCQAWGKFTGEADYDQPFHCDYVNHTLTAPADEDALNSVTYILLFSDVTRPDSLKVTGPEGTMSGDPALQEALKPYERSAAAPAGSIFVYGIDIWHRGTNLTAPGGHRYVMTVTYRARTNTAINHTVWPIQHMKPWRIIFENGSPEQLALFGVQKPGDPFWTETTLARTQARYPKWDLTLWREAMAKPAAREASKAPADLEV